MSQVLVVGAGPVGLTMACELARHGQRCRIVDKLAQPSGYCKAIGVTPRTLEDYFATIAEYRADEAATLSDRVLLDQLEQWGRDAEAETALANRRRDFMASASFLVLLDL